MHFKYSSVLVQVFVSFMYGTFIPLLFLTTLFGIFNMYVVERLCLAFYFRQPPLYDAKLNLAAIKILKGAPILMFMLGYWFLSNRQIFFNEPYDKIVHANGSQNPGHNLLYLNNGLNHSHMVIVVCIAVIG